MNKKETVDNLIKDLKYHIKIKDIKITNEIISCEVDRIQSTATSIVHRISKKYGNFKITSSTKNVKNIGFTTVNLYL